jgi:hypothetical protein
MHRWRYRASDGRTSITVAPTRAAAEAAALRLETRRPSRRCWRWLLVGVFALVLVPVGLALLANLLAAVV